MALHLIGIEHSGGPGDPELEEMARILEPTIGRVLENVVRRGVAALREPCLVAGRRRSFALAETAEPEGRGGWCVVGRSRLDVARRWLEAGRTRDAAALLEARCDEGQIPLVFVFTDGTVSVSTVRLRTGGVA